MTTRPRVGIVGYAHEVNALAEPITLALGLQVADAPGGLAATWDAGPLLARMREGRDVEIVELPVWEFGASGPLIADDFRTVLAQVAAALRAAGPLDAVAVLGHGAGASTDDRDTDGTFLRMLREHVGEHVPIVAVLDFHANLSAAMVDACDVVVGYRTNPHVDIHDRLIEAVTPELAVRDIRINAVCPMYVRTPMETRELAWEAELRGVSVEEVFAGYETSTPLGRVADPNPKDDHRCSLEPEKGWSVAEELTPEGAELLEVLTREVRKRFSKKQGS